MNPSVTSAAVMVEPESVTSRRLTSVWRLAAIFSVAHLAYLATSLIGPEHSEHVALRAVASLMALTAAAVLAFWAYRSARDHSVHPAMTIYVCLVLAVAALGLTLGLTFPLGHRSTTTGEPLLSMLIVYLSVWSVWFTRPHRLAEDSGQS